MNHTVTTAFTADGQTASVTDNLNNTTAYAYGHLGELLSTTDALNHTTSDEYDTRYRLVQTTAADGGVTLDHARPGGQPHGTRRSRQQSHHLGLRRPEPAR